MLADIMPRHKTSIYNILKVSSTVHLVLKVLRHENILISQTRNISQVLGM